MKRLKRSVIAFVLVGIFVCTIGCATIKSQVDPYVIYSSKGVKDAKTGEVRNFMPYWREKPWTTTGKFILHLGTGYLIYEATKNDDTPAQTPTETPVEEEPVVPPAQGGDL